MSNATAFWETVADAIRAQVSDGVWNTTFKEMRVEVLGADELVLTVPNQWVKERIERRYVQLVRDALDEASPGPVHLMIEVDAQQADPTETNIEQTPSSESPLYRAESEREPVEINLTAPPSNIQTNRDLSPNVHLLALRDHLNPRYTFETFVTGASNRFAQAAALSVAELPGRSYNPLFIHGHAGLGKTHLLQAIGNYVRENYADHRILYVSTEAFLNEFVEAIRSNKRTEFKRRYREIDVLLVDDIQFLEGKEGLQEEFFHTFNTLYQSNKQIVLSSDRMPDAIGTLEDRLRSRFKMGLITDIQPPDIETRLAILRRKAESEAMPVPHEVLEFIASHVRENIRELEGALIRVCAYASLNDRPLTIELANSVLSDLVAAGKPRPITANYIIDTTAEMFDFGRDEIIGQRRHRPLVTARQIAMYVIREMTDLSYPAIAKEFGGRDHTTVIHAVAKISALMSERRQIFDQVTELTQRLRQNGP